MGTWGYTAFENDPAFDWADQLDGASDLTVIIAALATAIETTDYLEVDEGSAAVAAAELVAALKGQPHPELPEAIAAWVQQHPHPVDAQLSQLALQAIERVEIVAISELAGLCEETEYFLLWQQELQHLRIRLT